MKSSAKKVELASVDDLFSTEESRADAQREKVMEIPLSELHPFKDHPFKVKDDEAMMETADSIRQYGVLVPAIARPDPNGGYELVAGHRRHRASELAGKETMPVIVRDLDDDQATIIMVDSNLQRESLLPSERAFAYKMKLEAMKRQAGRPSKENCSQVGNDFGKKSSEVLAEQVGQSKNQIFRYIRLTELIPELLDMVDEKKIAFNPAYELSFLKKEEQVDLLDAMDSEQATPSLSQAQRDGQRTGHAVALPGPAAEKVQPGGPPDPRHDAGHYGRGKEKRPGQDHLHQRHPAQIFPPELYAPADAGDHHQAAGTVAAQAPATA